MKGLFYGDGGQFVAEGIGVLANVVYIGAASFVVFKLIAAIVGQRVDPDAEINGLDVPEMGVPGYVGVKLDKHSETPLPVLVPVGAGAPQAAVR